MERSWCTYEFGDRERVNGNPGSEPRRGGGVIACTLCACAMVVVCVCDVPWLCRLYYRLCADVPWLYRGTGYRLCAYQVPFYDVLSGVPHRGCVLIWCLFMTCRFNIMMGHQQPIATQCLFKSISFRFKVVEFCYGYRSIRAPYRVCMCTVSMRTARAQHMHELLHVDARHLWLTRQENRGKRSQNRDAKLTRPFLRVGRGWLARLTHTYVIRTRLVKSRGYCMHYSLTKEGPL